MQCRAVLAMFLISAVFLVPVRADDSEAKAIIDKAVEAMGGREKLTKYKAATWNDQGKFYGMGSGGVDYTGEYAIQFPDKFKMTVTDVFTIVVDGEQGWMTMAGGGATKLNDEQLKETQEQVHAGWVASLVPILEKDYRLSKLDPIEIDGKPAVGVKVSHKDHRDVKLYFDQKTHRLAKVEYPVKAEELGGKEVTQEEFYMDYQEIEGMPVPMKMKVLRDGEKFIEAEHSNMKFSEKLPEDTFAKPE